MSSSVYCKTFWNCEVTELEKAWYPAVCEDKNMAILFLFFL